jgi:hypothetical protein
MSPRPIRLGARRRTILPGVTLALFGLSLIWPRPSWSEWQTFTTRQGLAGNRVVALLAIAFVMGRAGSVSVKVFNRGGRLVREVAKGESMGEGANLVRWDGRDRDGTPVGSGVYLVTVEALGETRTQTLAVAK